MVDREPRQDLSSSRLNITVSQPERSLTFLGNVLKRRGPFTGSYEDLIVFMEHGADVNIGGILHSLPCLLC